MTKALYPHKDEIKAAILAGESYADVAKRYGAFPPEVHTLLRKDPDIVAAKASGALRTPGRAKQSLEDCLAQPGVEDVIHGGMSTLAAAKKHGVSQPTLWAKVRRAKELMGIEPPKQATAAPAAPPTPTPTSVSTPMTPATDPEIDAIKALLAAYAARHQINYEQARNLLSSFSAQYQQQDKP